MTYPPGYPPQPDLVAQKWFKRIELSPTIPMLREIGQLIAGSDLSEERKALARGLYAARMEQLKPLVGLAGDELAVRLGFKRLAEWGQP